MKYVALCVGLLSCTSAAHAAPKAAKNLSTDFNLTTSGAAGGEFLGTLKLKGTSLSGTFVSQSFGYVYNVNAGSTLKAKVLHLTCTLTNPVADVITLSGKLNSLTGKGKGSFSESFFNEAGTYVATKAP
jgi:hypothetical protein